MNFFSLRIAVVAVLSHFFSFFFSDKLLRPSLFAQVFYSLFSCFITPISFRKIKIIANKSHFIYSLQLNSVQENTDFVAVLFNNRTSHSDEFFRPRIDLQK